MTEPRPHLQPGRRSKQLEAFYETVSTLKGEDTPYVVLRGMKKDFTDEMFEKASEYDLELVEFSLMARGQLLLVASPLCEDMDEDEFHCAVLTYLQEQEVPFEADLPSPYRH
ncbi:MAG: hypothetical protein H6922_03230 [Pseudomonadaceae bacterium]|nr:hypothetical protein [Pseudomonadaceae bacterium]